VRNVIQGRHPRPFCFQPPCPASRWPISPASRWWCAWPSARRKAAPEILVATDHEEVKAAVEQHGFAPVMTRADHASGTDRIAEVAAQRGWSDDVIVVNVQGDEPCIEPELIDQMARELTGDPDAAVATACHPIGSAEEFFNPNVVKVVCDASRPCPVFQPRADSLAARRLCGRPQRTCPRRCRRNAISGSMLIAVAFLRRYGALGLRRWKVSRRSNSCAFSGMASASALPGSGRRPKPELIRRKIWPVSDVSLT
jgi:hypothetical protein